MPHVGLRDVRTALDPAVSIYVSVRSSERITLYAAVYTEA